MLKFNKNKVLQIGSGKKWHPTGLGRELYGRLVR